MKHARGESIDYSATAEEEIWASTVPGLSRGRSESLTSLTRATRVAETLESLGRGAETLRCLAMGSIRAVPLPSDLGPNIRSLGFLESNIE